MKKILITISACLGIMMPTAQANDYINAFVEGTQWNVAKVSTATEENEKYMVHYTLEGTATINDQECIQYWESYDNGTKLLAGYVYTEGDKVYCYRRAEDETPELIYDFGMAEGDSICVGIVCINFNEKFDPHSYQVCSGTKTIMSCGHKYKVQTMLEYHDSSYSEEPLPYWDENDWVAGIGGIRFLGGDFANWGYGLIGGGADLETVVCNGETIFDRNDVTETSISLPASDPVSSVIYNLDGTRHSSSAHGLRVENGHVVWR